MADGDQRAALQLAAAGITGQVVGFVANTATLGLESPRLAGVFALMITFGAAIAVLGGIRLAIAKGHPWYVGLLGLLSVVGIAALWLVVPDRTVITGGR